MRLVGQSDAVRLIGLERAKAATRGEYKIETGQILRAFPPPNETRQAHSELYHTARDGSFGAFTFECLTVSPTL